MQKRAIIVQARMSSSRLPGKSLRLIGEQPLLFYVLKRLEKTGIPLVVATSDHSSDDEIADYLESLGVPVFRGALENVLQRYIDCAEAFGIEEIIRITGDNPLVDVEALTKAEKLFEDYPYLDAIYPNGWIKGSGFEFVTLRELKNICPSKRAHREHVTLALREKIPFREDFLALPVPEYQKNYTNKIVLTCDYPEDFQLLKEIYEHFNYSTNISINEVLSLYDTHREKFRPNLPLHL